MRNLPALTGLRAAASLGVVGFHAYLLYLWAGAPNGVPLGILNHLWIGVDLFFVLSGFLLALPLLDRPDSFRKASFWKSYLSKRWFRIAPPYYVSILVVLAAGGTLAYLRTGLWDVLAHIFYIHNFHQPFFGSITGVYWTLALEFQFYLVLPLAVVLFSGRRWGWALAGSIAFSLAWRGLAYDPSHSSWMALQLPAFWGHFALGIVAARLHKQGWNPTVSATPVALAWLAAFVVVPLALMAGPGYSYGTHKQLTLVLLRPTLGFGFAGLILLATAERGAFQWLLANPVSQALGEASYSLYLIHIPVIAFLLKQPLALAHGFSAFALYCAVATILAAFVYYALIEKPSLLLKDFMVGKKTVNPRPQPAGPLVAAAVAFVAVDAGGNEQMATRPRPPLLP